jgi:hypothetical protein
MRFHRIHMVKVLYQKTGEIPSSGPPIDHVRLGWIGGTYLAKDLTLINALPSTLHQGSKGLRIF